MSHNYDYYDHNRPGPSRHGPPPLQPPYQHAGHEGAPPVQQRTWRPHDRSQSPEVQETEDGPSSSARRHSRTNDAAAYPGLSEEEVAFVKSFRSIQQGRVLVLLRAMKDTTGDHFVVPPAAACTNCKSMNWPCVSRISGPTKWACIGCTNGLRCSHTQLRDYRHMVGDGVTISQLRVVAFRTLDPDFRPIATPPADGSSVVTLWPANAQGRLDSFYPPVDRGPVKFYLPGETEPVAPPEGFDVATGRFGATRAQGAPSSSVEEEDEAPGSHDMWNTLIAAAGAAPRAMTSEKGVQATPPDTLLGERSTGSRLVPSYMYEAPLPQPPPNQAQEAVPTNLPTGRGSYAKLNLIHRSIGIQDTSNPNQPHYHFAPCAVDCPRCYAIELQEAPPRILTPDITCKFFNRVTCLDHQIVKTLRLWAEARGAEDLRRTPIPAYLYEAKVPCTGCADVGARCLHANIKLYFPPGQHGPNYLVTDSLHCLRGEIVGGTCVWSGDGGEAPTSIRVGALLPERPPESMGALLEELGAMRLTG